MNILLNFFPLQSGGGQQVAINFLKIVLENHNNHNWFFFVGENSEIHDALRNLDFCGQVFVKKYSYVQRITSIPYIRRMVKEHNIDLVYNYTTTLPLLSCPQVVRSVYSNLYFPELDFWNGYSLIEKIKKNFIDFFRLRGTLAADAIVFENEEMRSRAIERYHFPSERTCYVAPSVTKFDRRFLSDKYKFLDHIDEFKVLYLSSWHLNKNIHKLPEVAAILKKNGVRTTFVLSLHERDPNVIKYLSPEIQRFGVPEYFTFIGKVEAKYVHQVINSSNAMILLSKLECFSSNVVEAFSFQKPLVISNEAWSRSACQDAAIYVERNHSSSIADAVSRIVSSQSLVEFYVRSGTERLKKFNTPESKVFAQVKFLEKIYKDTGK